MSIDNREQLVNGTDLALLKEINDLHEVGIGKIITVPGKDFAPRQTIGFVLPTDTSDNSHIIILPTFPDARIFKVIPYKNEDAFYHSAYSARFRGTEDWEIRNGEVTAESLSKGMMADPTGYGCIITLRHDILSDTKALQEEIDKAFKIAKDLRDRQMTGKESTQLQLRRGFDSIKNPEHQ